MIQYLTGNAEIVLSNAKPEAPRHKVRQPFQVSQLSEDTSLDSAFILLSHYRVCTFSYLFLHIYSSCFIKACRDMDIDHQVSVRPRNTQDTHIRLMLDPSAMRQI